MVFEGRNQNYGAYVQRIKSPKRHTLSVLYVLIAAAAIIILPRFIEMIKPAASETDKEQVVEMKQLKQAEVKQKEREIKIEKPVEQPQAVKSSVKFTAPVIKKDEEVSDDKEMKTQEDIMSAKGSVSIADVKGNDEAHGQDIADLKQIVTQAPEEETKVFTIVEQMPTFPGGEAALLKWLGDHIKYPVIAEENGIQGRVVVTFVVERDGSVSDVKVVRSVDPSLDKEAIRVVRSMPKWIPGKQNGSSVRVQYTLPVMFRLAS